MIRRITICAAAALLSVSCQKSNVTVTGNIKEAAKQKVYLEQLNVDHPVVIDSAVIGKDGGFKFKLLVEQPTFFNVKVGDKESAPFIAQADEQIEISGSLPGLHKNYWVDGSENSLWVKLLNFQLNNTTAAMDTLKQRYAAIPEDTRHDALRQAVIAEWDSVIRKQINFSKDFILKHAVSPAAYYALYQKFDDNNFVLTPEEDLHSYKIVASSLKAMYPESQYTRAILKHLDQISQAMQNARILEIIANTESSLPEVKLPNAKGDTVALSSLKGKYIVLDFTVLAAKDNETYIRDLKQMYNRLRHRGVQIYQICLDENQLLWERLVKQYGIDWICVRDPQALKSRVAQQWNVQSVPANYIISPKYEIVGKNLSGKRLEERLTDLMK